MMHIVERDRGDLARACFVPIYKLKMTLEITLFNPFTSMQKYRGSEGKLPDCKDQVIWFCSWWWWLDCFDFQMSLK